MPKIVNIEPGLAELLRKQKGCSFFASQGTHEKMTSTVISMLCYVAMDNKFTWNTSSYCASCQLVCM